MVQKNLLRLPTLYKSSQSTSINKINLLFTSSPTQQNAKTYRRLCHVSPMKSVQGHSDWLMLKVHMPA